MKPKIIMLALHDYCNHTTDEGWQLQQGLMYAGVTLYGKGYGYSLRHIPDILSEASPDVVIVADPRDWDASMGGAYDKTAGFTGCEHLLTHPCVLPVYKDAGACPDYQRRFHQMIGANGWICYYHPQSVVPLTPWIDPAGIIRTYHTIDPQSIPTDNMPRRGTIISGARNGRVYPLRERILADPGYYGADVRGHPGYGNAGCDVTNYYHHLSQYKVSIATASAYGFALRKMLEGVACGCTVIGDLPAWDQWPDVPMIRIASDTPDEAIRETIRRAEDDYSPSQAEMNAARVIERYSYHAETRRLYGQIEEHWRETTGK